MAKRVRVSGDSGVTFYTLPGNSGELTDEAGELDDTIFGQDYGSTQTGLIGWTLNANGLFKGFAGYQTKILQSGTATSMTAEAMSVVSGKTYQVTAATKRMFDRANAIVVYDNAVDHTDDVISIDYLFGRITFASGYTPTGPITVDAYYFPTSVLGCANEFTLTQTAQANDVTCMDTAQGNNGHRVFDYGLKTVSLELNGIFKAANGLLDLLIARSEVIIEVDVGGNGKTVARGFFKPVSTSQSGDVGDLESESVTFNLAVPDDATGLIPYPFSWMIAADSTINAAIEACLNAWEDKSLITVQYLWDGTNGKEGEGVVTDLTLSGGLEGMNEFTVNFQGSGELADVP